MMQSPKDEKARRLEEAMRRASLGAPRKSSRDPDEVPGHQPMSDLPAPKWFVAHHRVGPSVYFGPFDTPQEAAEYADAQCAGGGVIPLHPPVPAEDIDWEGSRLAAAIERPPGGVASRLERIAAIRDEWMDPYARLDGHDAMSRVSEILEGR
jgi:hypothetical protein